MADSSPKPRYKAPSIIWKMFIIGALILILLIPLGMIGGIISERETAKQNVQLDIARTWASEQTLLGPVLVVPYQRFVHNEKAKPTVVRAFAYVLPQKFSINGAVFPEKRYRGIYQSIVYVSDMAAQGNFDLATINELDIPKNDILWKDAFIVLGIPSMQGVSKKPEFNVNSKPLELLPGVNSVPFINSGMYTAFPVTDSNKPVSFNFKLSLKGSQSLSVVPVGKQNSINLHSSWESPSFIGSTLPNKRDVSGEGFSATWDIPYFARNYGQVFSNSGNIQMEMAQSAVGVQLLTPVDSYRQSDRAVKYGVLFIVLTFATFFIFEVITRYRLHPFQYLLVGFSLALFYLLLIAISEVLKFEMAYAIASFGTIATITLYSKAILGKIRKSAQWFIGGLLTALYGYLFVLLQLEDLSLLFGSIGLFAVLGISMYVTRNIDWYNEEVPA